MTLEELERMENPRWNDFDLFLRDCINNKREVPINRAQAVIRKIKMTPQDKLSLIAWARLAQFQQEGECNHRAAASYRKITDAIRNAR